MIEEIFEKQRKFQKLLKIDTTTQEFKNLMFLGLFEESVELMKETPFKCHKKKQQFNKEKFLEECVDLQLYLINLVMSETTSEEFLTLIKQKQQINFNRQAAGY